MRCKPCGAPRNPSADRCDYCQSWHEGVPPARNPYSEYRLALAFSASDSKDARIRHEFQSQMMANQAQYQIQRSYLSGLRNAYAGIGGLLGRGF